MMVDIGVTILKIWVQEKGACVKLSTFIQAAARKCETKLPVRCFPQSDHTSEVQRHTVRTKKHTVSEMRPMSTQQPQPLRTFTAQVRRNGAKPLAGLPQCSQSLKISIVFPANIRHNR